MKHINWMPLLTSFLAVTFLSAGLCEAQAPAEVQSPDVAQPPVAEQATTLSDDEVAQLLIRINASRKAGNVTLRSNVGDAYRLADYYLEQGNDDRARQLYIYALQVDGWNLPYQLKLAQLLLKQGDKDQAIEKAQYILNYAEDYTLIDEAKQLLAEMDVKAPAIEQQKSPASGQGIEIVLVPIGSVNRQLLSEVIAEFEEDFGINYSIGDMQLAAGEPSRNMAERALDDSITNIKSTVPPEMFAQLLSAVGLAEENLDTFENKKTLVGKYFEMAGAPPEYVQNFQSQLTELQALGQYEAQKLLDQLKQKCPLDKKPSHVAGYMGITELDIYGGEANYLFYFGGSEYNIGSYYRYLAATTLEPPDRTRLRQRLAKQILWNTLSIFNVPKCTSPICGHRYVHSLVELDQLRIGLCSPCATQLQAGISAMQAPAAAE